MDIETYNRAAWDRDVERQNRWTVPVEPHVVARARLGDFSIVLTPTIPVPRDWFPPLHDTRVLCLASGGGQQAPILAAAGASVTVLDNSPRQLEQDRLVADRDGLDIETVLGNMADLSAFDDETFDLIFHPVSNCFAAEVRPVWRECFRVLRPGGVLLAGFNNPARYIFDNELSQRGEFQVRHRIPYSDERDLEPAELNALIERLEPLEFGHSLDDQIGGQLEAGFVLIGFYEDRYDIEADDPLSQYLATFIATRAVKP